MKLFNFCRQDCSAAAAKYFYMTATIFIQQVFHVFKKLHMAALVTGNCNALHIFFNSTFNNFCNTSVMTKMNYFCAFALHYPAHNIYCRIMPVKQRSRRNYPNIISGSKMT